MKMGTIAFKNDQGHVFDFKIYPMDAVFKEGHGGVYIITKRHDEPKHHHGHHIIYIGESDDMAMVMSDHPEKELFDREGANCCCVHATQDPEARQRIASELQAKYMSA